ncbi:hypothetical protein LV779_35800 [Streptomyces thinghirensis]|nr:hypothetical protein [Streptomyces thinghirensis]
MQGKDAMNIGLHLLPMIGAPGHRCGRRRPAGRQDRDQGDRLPPAWVLWVAGLGLLSTVNPDTDFMVTGTALAIMGLAWGFTCSTTLDAILGSLPNYQVGAGSRSRQAACGKSVLQWVSRYCSGSVVELRLPQRVRRRHSSQVCRSPHRRRSGTATWPVHSRSRRSSRPRPPASSLRTSARDAFVAGMSTVSLICAGLAAVTAVVVAVLLPARDRQPLAADEAEEKAQAKSARL